MFDIRRPTWRQSVALAMLIVIGLMLSGWILADRLMPPAVGSPSTTLPLQPDQTVIDRELAPLLATHPGQSGVILLSEGLDAFAARVMATRQAGRSLDVQYYIWHDDITGRLLAHELWEAAERGVRVRLLLDDMNAVDKDVKWLALDSHPNIELRLYNPFRNRQGLERVIELLQRAFSLNHRMHNKAWIADGRAAIVGGRNVGVEYFDASQESNFRDLDALVFGPVVGGASDSFDAYWNSAAVVPISALKRKPSGRIDAFLTEMQAELKGPEARAYMQRVADRKALHDYAEGRLTPHWSAKLRIVADPPIKRTREAHTDWLVDRIEAQLRTTRQQALLISPYFVPGDDFTEAMVGACERAGRSASSPIRWPPTMSSPCMAVMRAIANACWPAACNCTNCAPNQAARRPAAPSAAAAPACIPRPTCWMGDAASSVPTTWTRARPTSTPRWA